MSMSVIRKTDRKCVLCKHWNGAVGSTTIQPKLGGQLHTMLKHFLQRSQLTDSLLTLPESMERKLQTGLILS